MMKGGQRVGRHVLITGGAGFIGSHLADEMLRSGYRVRAFDNLSAQVHGPEKTRPEYLDKDVELVIGDVRDPDAMRRALKGIDGVFHFAAMVGVGQSMYEIVKYTEINNTGTAVLLETLMEHPVERLIVASSMSVYGEGLYRAPDGRTYNRAERTLGQLRRGHWEIRNPKGELLTPIPTPESKPPSIASIYALSKYDQEKMCLVFSSAYKIPAVGLRFFNVFGPRQALSNPYTGVLAIFASRYLNGNAPLIYEDGKQQRDFVSVYDVVRACRLAFEIPESAGHVFNVGSGRKFSILEITAQMARALGMEHIQPTVTGKYRTGDIRHCFADISLARRIMGYEPQVKLDEGLVGLAEYLQGKVAFDYVAKASSELAIRGLTV